MNLYSDAQKGCLAFTAFIYGPNQQKKPAK